MKKIIIIAAVILSSGLTAYCLTSKQNNAITANTIKINKTDFTVRSLSGPKTAMATAD